MKRALGLLIAGTLLSGAAAWKASAADAAAELTLTRLACGAGKAPVSVAGFSDTNAHDNTKMALVASCYLIRHGDDVMLWDTGFPAALRDDPKSPTALPMTVVDQLRALGIDPAKVDRVGVSHYHGDHIGQARDFPGATLMIGAADWAALTATPPTADPAPLKAWTSGGGKVDPVKGDKDVFGDGSVVMIDTPGHTPGHHSLLVRLKNKGNVLLTGDLSHFHANYAINGVPKFNTNRADTLASLDRFKAMATNLKATVVIQHDPTDVAKLPAFPAAAD